VARSGEAIPVALPLNENQRASDMVASRDGQFLAYLVWEGDAQHGVAAWDTSGPNARLVARPIEGYRITGVTLLDDASYLLVTQVQADLPLGSADWRIEAVDPRGGDPFLLLGRDALESSFPPEPLAWLRDGPLLVNLRDVDGTSRGMYAYDPASGQSRLLIEGGPGAAVHAPQLAPEGARIAYLTLNPDLLPEGAQMPHNTLVVYDLRLGEGSAMPPPQGYAILSALWHPDGERLLLDLLDLTAEPGAGQRWALVRVGEPQPWTLYDAGPDRARLFDLRPFGEGVIYTTLPDADGLPALVFVDELLEDAPASVRVTPLETFRDAEGAPVIIFTPIG